MHFIPCYSCGPSMCCWPGNKVPFYYSMVKDCWYRHPYIFFYFYTYYNLQQDLLNEPQNIIIQNIHDLSGSSGIQHKTTMLPCIMFTKSALSSRNIILVFNGYKKFCFWGTVHNESISVKGYSILGKIKFSGNDKLMGDIMYIARLLWSRLITISIVDYISRTVRSYRGKWSNFS